MASATVHQPESHATSFEPIVVGQDLHTRKRDVPTTLNYYKDPRDGSKPPAAYVGRPETYDRLPLETTPVTVHDIRGEEHVHTLDTSGFQIYKHVSVEKDFLDDEKIKAEYYPETEQLLKDASVIPAFPILHQTANQWQNRRFPHLYI
jgi:hypothetical protein